MIFVKHSIIILAMVLLTPGLHPEILIICDQHPTLSACRYNLILAERECGNMIKAPHTPYQSCFTTLRRLPFPVLCPPTSDL